MRAAAWCLLVLVLALPGALAQDASYFQGGEPGVRVALGGEPIEAAQTPALALEVDPRAPLALSIAIAPPAGETWEVRAIQVGMLVRGPGSTPPAALTRRMDAEASLPPGFTVVVNRTLDLSAMQRLGAGTFLMQAQVMAADDAALYTQAFYVHVPGSVASLLTAQGAALTAVSVATGYGLWQILKDVHELREARNRHRREERERLLSVDVLGTAQDAAEAVAAKVRPLSGIVGLQRQARAAERRLGPVRWAATGMGLGGVAIAWGQFFGLVALDATRLVATALEVGAVALTLALVANALVQRARARREAEATRRVPVQGPAAEAPEADRAAPVQEGF